MPGRSLRLQLPGKSYPEREAAYTSPAKIRRSDAAETNIQRTPSDPNVRLFASPSKAAAKPPQRAHTSPGLARMKLPNLKGKEGGPRPNVRAQRGRIGNSKSGAPKVRRAAHKQKSGRNYQNQNQNPNRREHMFSHYNYGRPSVPSVSGYSRQPSGYYGANRAYGVGRQWVNPTRPW